MKLVSFLSRGVASYGILEGTEIRDIGHALRGQWLDLKTMLGQDSYRKIASETRVSAPVLALSEVELLPPMKAGDVVEIEIASIGTLRNTMAAEPQPGRIDV